jgi:hypothetical protein
VTKNEMSVKHARLRDAVVEAAQVWKREFGGNVHLEVLASSALAISMDDLNAFESQYGLSK